MNTKTISTFCIGVMATLTTGAFAQVPGNIPNPDQAAPQLQQQATQIQNQAKQDAGQVKQDANKAQQQANQAKQQVPATPTVTPPGNASFLQKAEAEVGKIATVVQNLSPEQKAKLTDLFGKIFAKKSANKAMGATDPAVKTQQNSEVAKMKSDGLKAILNSDQLAALKAAAQKKVSDKLSGGAKPAAK